MTRSSRARRGEWFTCEMAQSSRTRCSVRERRVTARLQHAHRGESGDTVVADWQLETLVAYLFERRECHEVRSLLARGEGRARGMRITWDPVDLSPDEFQVIERGFPEGKTSRP